MNPDAVVSAAIAGGCSLASVAYVRFSTKAEKREEYEATQDVERQRLEADAYDRAKGSYETALATSTGQITRLETRVEACERRAAAAEIRGEQLANALVGERERVRTLTTIVAALRRELSRHGIEIPDHLT